MSEPPTFQDLRPGAPGRAGRDMLAPTVRLGLLAAVVVGHVGVGWALTQASSTKLIVGDVAPMEVRMVAGEPASAPQVESAEPPPPVDLKPPDLATIVDPPPPDLPPPEFPMAKLDLPPPQEPPPPVIPKPVPKPEPKPVAKPQPKAPEPAKPVREQEASPNSGPKPVEGVPRGAPQAAAGPRTVSAAQLGYLVPPNPVYPARSRKAGEQGSVTVRVLVDAAGRPSQVLLQASSGHPALDEAAVSAVRAAQFRPYADGGTPQAVWVLVPINFVLR
ncbi:MAG: energy transducer TonB [Proteobacteria bacterium]|nr:energy transducer TonB [Pseudomonadota bacterium]